MISEEMDPDGATLVTGARSLFATGQWNRCYAVLADAARTGPLPLELLELYSQVAHLVGREDACLAICFDAYRRFEDAGEHRNAARVAFWAAFMLYNRLEVAQARAWQARSWELVGAYALGGAEECLLVGMEGHTAWLRRQLDVAMERTERALVLGLAAGEADGVALARVTRGRIDLQFTRTDEAMASFDEAMASVSAGETSARVAGTIYCAVISACWQIRDLRRATEWTRALSAWCDARPDLVPYRGTCLVHRAQLHTLRGEWPTAVTEAQQAAPLLSERQVGEAVYQLGELSRLAGDFGRAEDDYRRANGLGFQPEPGLARLRVAQGRADVAVTTLRRLLAEPRTAPVDRADLLAALVEALLAAGDPGGAGASAAELTGIAADLDAPLLSGLAALATGSVLCAQGRSDAALAALRTGWHVWQELDLPYLAARTRLLIGRCLLALADQDAAQLEFDAARDVFTRLGAVHDLKALDAVATAAGPLPGGLTHREVQVIRLVATGLGNRAIAKELYLSEKTVARHLSNIYAKLGIPSRSAATAYAYAHGLVPEATTAR